MSKGLSVFGTPVRSTGPDSLALQTLRDTCTRRISVTGHRTLPDKPSALRTVQAAMDAAAEQALWGVEGTDSIVYTGMALGWDIAIARACDKLSIPFVAVIPCPNQAVPWARDQQMTYARFIQRAKFVHSVFPQTQHGVYYYNALKLRNTVLVAQATEILALHDGRSNGGTTDALTQAVKKGLPIFNAWRHYEKLI